jgi:hypothetical protein
VMSPILFLILTLIGISILALIIITLTIKIIKKIKQ